MNPAFKKILDVLRNGTYGLYLCINKTDEPLILTVMNTDNTLSFISAMIASEASYRTLVDMIDEMGLELMDINMA